MDLSELNWMVKSCLSRVPQLPFGRLLRLSLDEGAPAPFSDAKLSVRNGAGSGAQGITV